MTSIAVYDPPMCCSSGVCGPDGDSTLVRFAADLEWAGRNGVKVERYNLGHEPAAFATNPIVRAMLEQDGMSCLPLVMSGSRVLTKGAYPSRETLVADLGIALASAEKAGSSCCAGASQTRTGCCSA